jgi:NADH-quinone oxidoreductase subunit D
VEDITKIETPRRAKYIRTIISELERIHSHLLYLGLEAEKTKVEDLFMRIFSERERVMDIFESLSGNRVHYGILELGGVRRDINKKKAAMITGALDEIESEMEKIEVAFEKSPLIKKTTEGKGILTLEEARKLDVVGPNARASGLSLDIRKLDPYAAYPEIDFDIITQSEGDVKARLMVRIGEIFESSRIIRKLLNNIPRGPIAVPVLEVPKGEAVGRAEAPRGENMYYVKSNGSLYPERVKIRTPTLANLVALKPMLMGEAMTETATLRTIVASIDPCFSCTDRMAIIEKNRVVGRRCLVRSEGEIRL